MALKKTHEAGDTIKAVDMNSQASAIIQNTHNIIQLFLENFFASKVTPFLGIFFDGFSDTTKADINTNTTINTVEKRLDLDDTFSTGVYESIVTSFQQSMVTVKLWVVRKINPLPITASIDLEESLSQFLSITDAAQTGLDITGNMTIECWFNPESFPNGRLVTKDNGVSRSFELAVSSATSIIFTNSSNGTDADDKGTFFTLTGGDILTVGTWVHIAVVYDAAGTSVELFLNGVSKGNGTGSINSSTFNSAVDFVIGAREAGVAPIDGKMDEVRIWNDKRTAAEILNNFDIVLTGSEANLQGYWRFENTLLDETSNNNDLINNNGATFSIDTPPQLAGNTDKQNLKAGIGAGATSLDVDGDQTGIFAIGDTIDISTPDNLTRERRVLTNVVFSTDTTLTWVGGLTNAFTVSDFVERVNVLPSISLVNIGDAKSFSTPTYVRSELGTGLALNGMETDEVEDEYEITFNPAEEDLKLKLDLTRNDVDLPVYAKRLGTSLNT